MNEKTKVGLQSVPIDRHLIQQVALLTITRNIEVMRIGLPGQAKRPCKDLEE